MARLGANPQSTVASGGHDLHYSTLQTLGVRLAGRVAGTDGSHVTFADDLEASVAFGDARAADLRAMLRQLPDIPLMRQNWRTRPRSGPTRSPTWTWLGPLR